MCVCIHTDKQIVVPLTDEVRADESLFYQHAAHYVHLAVKSGRHKVIPRTKLQGTFGRMAGVDTPSLAEMMSSSCSTSPNSVSWSWPVAYTFL